MSLVLLHGFAGAPSSWDAVRIDNAFAPALTGHGGPRVDSFVAEVDRLAALIPAGSHLAGYSLGGRLALGLLARHPHLFRRATILGAHPGLRSEAEREERAAADERWARLLEDEGSKRFASLWGAQPLFATQTSVPPEALAAQHAVRCSHDPHALAHAARVLSLARMPRWDLSHLRIPVTFMAGALDEKFAALAADLTRSVAGARLALVPGAGHNLLLERPDAVREELRKEPS
jgi:2-succinyl-6-hydroxy-2,4-cyclohexadiene-1-carboxylate synthase